LTGRRFPYLVTPNLFGDCPVETGKMLFPGESRGPDGMAPPVMDPGFRRGTAAWPNGTIAKRVQHGEKRRIAGEELWLTKS
jgi:hypothetical protein